MATDQLSVTFAALADPTRRAILARLSQGEASVTELAKPFDLSLPGISKHLKGPQRAVASVPAGRRPAEGSVGMGGGVPALLGREFRAPRRSSAGSDQEGEN